MAGQMLIDGSAFQSEGQAVVHLSAASRPVPRRFTADICLVIDVSGSMQLPATVKDREGAELSILDVVAHSCRTVIHTLTDSDRIGIVTYSDKAAIVLPLTAMDASGKAQAEAALSTLRADGQTNLWDGLRMGLEMLQDMQGSAGSRSGTMSSALLLTDGVPNVDPAGGHLGALEAYRSAAGGKLPCALHTFGFGSELDSKLLDDLASAGGGLYVFIPDAGFVGTALVNCSANAVTAAGHNAELVIHMEPGVHVAHCYGYPSHHPADGVCHIRLGSIQLGQTKDKHCRCRLQCARCTQRSRSFCLV